MCLAVTGYLGVLGLLPDLSPRRGLSQHAYATCVRRALSKHCRTSLIRFVVGLHNAHRVQIWGNSGSTAIGDSIADGPTSAVPAPEAALRSSSPVPFLGCCVPLTASGWAAGLAAPYKLISSCQALLALRNGPSTGLAAGRSISLGGRGA